MNPLNTFSSNPTAFATGNRGHTDSLLSRALDKLISMNNWANSSAGRHSLTNKDYRDLSPTRGHGKTDYSKPVWRR